MPLKIIHTTNKDGDRYPVYVLSRYMHTNCVFCWYCNVRFHTHKQVCRFVLFHSNRSLAVCTDLYLCGQNCKKNQNLNRVGKRIFVWMYIHGCRPKSVVVLILSSVYFGDSESDCNFFVRSDIIHVLLVDTRLHNYVLLILFLWDRECVCLSMWDSY